MLRNLFAAGAVAIGLAACATATPYQPIGYGGSSASGGFSEQQIERNRFRVTFAGNSLTSRERVETYLLFRSAELTLQNGHRYFQTIERETERDRRVYAEPSLIGPPWGYGRWSPFYRPHWRYYGGRFGWRSWSPFYGDPFWGDTVDYRTVDRFEATAEILMLDAAAPNDPKVFDAQEVVANLRPYIEYPGERR